MQLLYIQVVIAIVIERTIEWKKEKKCKYNQVTSTLFSKAKIVKNQICLISCHKLFILWSNKIIKKLSLLSTNIKYLVLRYRYMTFFKWKIMLNGFNYATEYTAIKNTGNIIHIALYSGLMNNLVASNQLVFVYY